MAERICIIKGCDRKHFGLYFCQPHYMRFRRHGHPLIGGPTGEPPHYRRPPEERFWAKVDKNGPVPEHAPELGQCWVWTGWKSSVGYGVFIPVLGGRIQAHNWAWINANGPIPEGSATHHVCENKLCCRPTHLRPMPPSEHMALHQALRRERAKGGQ